MPTETSRKHPVLTLFAVIGLVIGGVAWACYGGPGVPPEHPRPDSAADTTLSRAEARYMAQRKLVCVRNHSTFRSP